MHRWIVRTVIAFVMLCGGVAFASPASAAESPEDLLAAKYSPVVVIRDHPTACGDGEPYLPTAVESVLGKSDVVLRGPNGETITAPSAEDLAGKGDGWYVDLPGDPLSPGCDYETWFQRSDASIPPTIYAHVATDPDHPGKLALQYWFFWVFNNWNDKHEGDWEMIQLLFDADTPEQALASSGPVATAFAQHEGSETAAWDDPKVTKVGDHIVVYPSQGSHASYYTQADWFGRSASAGFGCDNTTALGREISPEVVVIPSDPVQQQPWVSFTGRWGQKAPSFNNGPSGPNTKPRWLTPVAWHEEGRPDSVALPSLGGPAVDSFCSLTAAGSLLFVTTLDHPIITGLVVLAILVVLFLLVRATRWRGTQWRTPDRERRAGQIVGASFGLLFGRLRDLWPIVLMTGLATAGALALNRLALWLLPHGGITDVKGLAWSDGFTLAHALSVVAILVVSLIGNIVIAFGMVAAARVTNDLAIDRTSSPWVALSRSITRPSAAIVQLLLFYAVTILASSLILLPLAAVLVAFFAVAMPAAAIEELGVITALKRSIVLTTGRRWRAVLLSALLIGIGFLLPGILGGIVLLLTGWPFWAVNIVAITFTGLLVPFAAIGLTLQYYDFRQETATPKDGSS